MTLSPEMARLQARRKVIEDKITIYRVEIGQREEAIAVLLNEDRELEIAAKVIERFSSPAPKQAIATTDGEEPEIAEEDSSKPGGIPTTPVMIAEAVSDAHSRGSPGLEPLGMLSYIQARYWPGASVNNIGPIAWRMWKRGQLVKKGVKYALPAAEGLIKLAEEANLAEDAELLSEDD